MQDWEFDKICTWVRVATTYHENNGVKFFIDLTDKSLFNLVLKNNEWKCLLNSEISVQYSKEQIRTLDKKIESLKNNKNEILEFPKLGKNEISYIQMTQLELKTLKKNQVAIDWKKYQKIIYNNPTNFGIDWIKKLGFKIEELSRIGF